MATPLNVTITAIFAFLVSTIVFSSSSVRACLTCGTPDPVDITSRIHCGEKMSSIINGINGKCVSQCHSVDIETSPFLKCNVKKSYNSINDQPLLHHTGYGYIAYRIFSPGFFTQQCYDTKLFCAYNIKCPPNHFLYYQYIKHDIENPTSSGDCLDSITIFDDFTPFYHATPTCGQVGCNGKLYSDYGVSQFGYSIQNLRVQFRSNKNCAASGYFLWAYCIDINKQNSPGCQSSSSPLPSFSPSPINERKRRRLITIEESINELTIPFGSQLVYSKSTIVITGQRGNSTFNNIYLLRVTFDKTTKSYYQPDSVTLYGEGRLKLYPHYAEYNIIGVPQSYKLTQQEFRNIAKLLSAAVEYVETSGDYNIVNDSNSTSQLISSQVTPTRTIGTKTKIGQVTAKPQPTIIPPTDSIIEPWQTKEQILPPPLRQHYKRSINSERLALQQLAAKSAGSCKAVVKCMGEFFQRVTVET